MEKGNTVFHKSGARNLQKTRNPNLGGGEGNFIPPPPSCWFSLNKQ